MTDSIMNQPLLLRCAALLLLLVLGHQTVGASPPGKKFIELGWDIPTTADLRQHWRDMEQTTPFDGIMFRVEALDEHANRVSSESVWDAKPWQRDWLKPALEDLLACQFQRFKDNFVRFNATPGNLAWDDDTGWAALAEKAGHCAWLMKQGGGKGLAIDFESYGAAQFHLNAEGNHYYFPPLNGSRLARLQRNLGFAREAADEYVWIYGEQCRWWGPRRELLNTVGQGRLWEEALPGITRAIAYTRDPLAAAKAELAELRQAGRLTNLAKNADFRQPASPEAGALPAEFGAWQDEKTSAGKFAWDAEVGDGSGRATKVKWGCLIQGLAVQPGEDYAVEVTCRPRGHSQPTLVIRWQTAEECWTQRPGRRHTPSGVQRPGVQRLPDAGQPAGSAPGCQTVFLGSAGGRVPGTGSSPGR